MDRTIIATLQQLRDFDFVQFEHDVLLGLGYLAQDAMSQLTTPVVAGFAASQTAPSSLSISIGAGRIYAPAPADATAAGSITQDLTSIIQQGMNSGQTLTLVPPSAGQSQWNLIQVQFQQADAIRTGDPNNGVVPFYNASNPTIPNYTSVNTVRQGRAIIQVIQGVAATTGSEVPPQPTSGWTPLYLIDLAGGQTTISTAQILKAGPSIGTGVAANYPYAPFLAGFQAAHHSGNPGQAPQIDLAKEVKGILPYANMSPVRTLLFAPLTLYVNGTSGNDSNNGTTANTAFKTIQKAIDTAYHSYDFNGFGCTINVANGTYTGGIYAQSLPAGLGSNPLSIVGNTSSPGSCVISVTNGNAVWANFGATVQVQGFTLQATGSNNSQGNGIWSENGASVIFGSIVFGACSNSHIYASTNGSVYLGGTLVYTVAGAAPTHAQADTCSLISIGGGTLTFNNTPAFSTAFAFCNRCSNIQFPSMTFTGSCTGSRYNAQLNGTIVTQTANQTYLPGSTAGSLNTGGQYN